MPSYIMISPTNWMAGDDAEGCSKLCKPAYIGDKNCDSECFNSACKWDGGDCDDQCRSLQPELVGLLRIQAGLQLIHRALICVLQGSSDE